jgi:hypothetical protein
MRVMRYELAMIVLLVRALEGMTIRQNEGGKLALAVCRLPSFRGLALG